VSWTGKIPFPFIYFIYKEYYKPARRGNNIFTDMPKITVYEGTRIIAEQSIVRPRTLIGRLNDNTIVIDHMDISRHHAQIENNAITGEITVRDLGSLNGTYKNNARIEIAPLADGDTFSIGIFNFLFSADSRKKDL
jgi:pSer/pThr/pTyr-binding forkhead associated (FHA) protein